MKNTFFYIYGKLIKIIFNFVKWMFLLVSTKMKYPYISDRGLITKYLSTFRTNQQFISAYNFGIALLDEDPGSKYRMHQAIWATSVAITNNGDWIELGTGRGFTMSGVLHYHQKKWNAVSNNCFLVDTFLPYGVDKNTGLQLDKSPKNSVYCDNLDLVIDHFKKFKNVHIVKGRVPECLKKIKSDKISFLHIDLNNAKPEFDGLSILWDKLIKGAVILLDDYGFPNRRDQHDAMNEFAHSHNIEIFQLPTGQGLMIK